jgi:hypothetical protein
VVNIPHQKYLPRNGLASYYKGILASPVKHVFTNFPFLHTPVLEFGGIFLGARLYTLGVPIASGFFCTLVLVLLYNLLLALVWQVALAPPHISPWALGCILFCHRTLLFRNRTLLFDYKLFIAWANHIKMLTLRIM